MCLRTAQSAWSLCAGRPAIKAQAWVVFLGPSQWAVCLSVGISTTCSAWWPCTTTAIRTAAFSVPPARPSTVSKPATSHLARWSTTLFHTRCPDTPTAKPSGLFTTSPLAFRYESPQLKPLHCPFILVFVPPTLHIALLQCYVRA